MFLTVVKVEKVTELKKGEVTQRSQDDKENVKNKLLVNQDSTQNEQDET